MGEPCCFPIVEVPYSGKTVDARSHHFKIHGPLSLHSLSGHDHEQHTSPYNDFFEALIEI